MQILLTVRESAEAAYVVRNCNRALLIPAFDETSGDFRCGPHQVDDIIN